MAGISDLTRAVDLDPEFAQGLAELAYLTWVHSFLVDFEERHQLLNTAESLANRAIDIDPINARAFITLSRVAFDRLQWSEWNDYVQRSLASPDFDGRVAYNYAGDIFEIEFRHFLSTFL